MTRAMVLALLLAAAQAWGQSPFAGSVPRGEVSPEALPLSLENAIARGIQTNLGLILSQESARAAEGGYLGVRSRLLPNLEARIGESSQQVNLQAFGFSSFPGIPQIVGPFGVFDARVGLSQAIVDFKALRSTQAASEGWRAARLSASDAREMVALVVTDLYLSALAGSSRVVASEAQVGLAEALYRQARNLKDNGVAPAIDVLRAQVELQSQRQRLIATRNEYQKQKLRLAHAIGLPDGQVIRLTDALPEKPDLEVSFPEALEQAYRERKDYQSALARVKAAELARRAAGASRWPSLGFRGDYGTLGKSPVESHGTYLAALNLSIPVFEGGRIKGEELEADAALRPQRAQAEELRARIAFEIRSAMLDLQSARDQVEVSRSAVDLARQQEAQARDRFAAGVTNNLEVVQAQEALAASNENHIASLYAYQAAKAALARAVGNAETSLPRTLMGAK